MGRYIARRLLLVIPSVFGVALIVFFAVRLIPGDAVEARLANGSLGGAGAISKAQLADLRHDLGLDKPAYKQFWIWLGDAAHGDLGNSLQYRDQAVVSRIRQGLPISVELALMATIIGVAIAIPLGIISALRQDTWIDHIARMVAVGGISMPDFVLALLLLIFPAIWFNWFPYLKYIPFTDNPLKNLEQFILPAIAIGLRLTGTTMRMTRSSMLEVMRSDYIRTAWAKGLRERQVIVRHALKNAMIAPITIIGTQLGYLIGGTVIIETIFNLPGLGRNLVGAIGSADYPQIQGTVLFVATFFLLINLVVDMSYSFFDPRIRYA